MPPEPANSMGGSLDKGATALRNMRQAEWIAYIQSTVGIVAFFALGGRTGHWLMFLRFFVSSVIVLALGYAVGQRHSAIAAATLVGIVLGVAVWNLSVRGRVPAIFLVAFVALAYGRAFNSAQEYAKLSSEPSQAAPRAS